MSTFEFGEPVPCGFVGCGWTTRSGSAATWSFGGDLGVERWGDAGGPAPDAGPGWAQSPIALSSSDASKTTLPPINFTYRSDAAAEIVNMGFTIQANIRPGDGTLRVGDGPEFTLVQFHFHTPGEHTIDDHLSPVEMHLVHADATGELLVIGVMIEAGAEHPLLARVMEATRAPGFGDELGNGAEPIAVRLDDLDLNSLLPDDRHSFRYDGSLTTPPCCEGVNWIVLRSPIAMGSGDIAAMAERFSGPDFPEGNRRPLQPIGTRVIATDAP